jgi:two-component system, cell cycle response regulator DivK
MTSKRRVLIVEDNALVAKFYRMALERAGGFECLVTEDVPEMLAEIGAGRIDLVILDVALSNSEWQGRPIDGVELGRLIKSGSPRPLPILIATAHAMAGDRERLLALSGANDYVEKPIYDAQQLVDKVRELLREK